MEFLHQKKSVWSVCWLFGLNFFVLNFLLGGNAARAKCRYVELGYMKCGEITKEINREIILNK